MSSSDVVEPAVMHPTVIVALIGAVATAVAALIAWGSGRNSSVAVLQTALTDGFKALNDQQNAKIAALSAELSDLKSHVAGLEQRNLSLVALLRRNGLDIPRATTQVTVFAPFPEAASDLTEGLD